VMLSPSINTDKASISASAISKQPANGHATWNGKQLKYTPKADFCGADSFKYHITTVAGQSNTGTANVTVNCVQDAPTLTGVETINISVGTTKTETYVASDADGETLTATLKLLNKASLPSWINFTFVNNQGKLTLTPSDTDMGDYELELKVTDTANGMKLKRIMVKVRDDRPITLTSILLKTFSKPQEFSSPSGRKMNSLFFTGIKDSTGKLITGTYTLTVTVDPNVNFPVTILGKTLQPGKPTPVSYTIPSPGVV
ncbi:Ig-like domain-containing protein, partial [Vibrio atlanticus]|uniref:Ig-like domain-containing protein n=1 Tax=Vibrio atlanticus TaxID=693153 RepID=UPI0022AFF626